jgi:LmbE family N-acetylglucosaminyl deacetylase
MGQFFALQIWSGEVNILAAFAHPDDETIFIGGTLAMLASKGARVHIVLATRGEGGEVGEPPLCTQDELGLVREDELRCAVKELGVSTTTFLDYVDPRVDANNQARPFHADPESLTGQLLRLAHEHQAQILITHGTNGEYGHPAHILMNEAAIKAADHHALKTLYTISANFPEHPRPRHANEDDPADFVFSIEPWFQEKLAAARCHRTQNALFLRRSSKEAGRALKLEEVLMKVESLHRAHRRNEGDQEDALASFIQEKCADALLPNSNE